jgi:hypothetical protein
MSDPSVMLSACEKQPWDIQNLPCLPPVRWLAAATFRQLNALNCWCWADNHTAITFKRVLSAAKSIKFALFSKETFFNFLSPAAERFSSKNLTKKNNLSLVECCRLSN